ncbi:S-layer homology domain-containing protein [Cohnella thailandensis]|uniref:S-layer homology domain-containing protein n=1 Tax=Cohnella thailandensis TaxID=557557 RepID=A0A841T578_9BACL|nr:S-layer homology domain-containing protein [Cohnella thailandensis]MBB6638129.1 S-layer homology domain-containing protein [Cohnella thailandensis]MBP1971944.1 hypothetical protein [Cohnella thailandensis]
MRDSSYKSSKQTTQQIPFQGGEKKVMKKSLSLLLALAMVFGLFASMASAADTELTTAQKLQQLVDKGVLKGKPDGLPHLEDNLSRAEFATIAIAIAGIAPSTSTSSAFKDVKVGQWWTSAIQAAYEAGLVNGVGNSLFSPKANVTVESVIKVAVAIAKLTPVEGATVAGTSAWAGPYVQAAIDANLPVPTNYKAPATRGQAIELAYAVFQGLQVKPLNDVKAVLNSDDTITVTGVTYGSDSVKVAIGNGTAVAATVKEDGSFTYTTPAQAAGTYTLTVTAYKGETSLASTTATVTVDGFEVSSVTVLNAKQIAVKFNKAVQEGVAVGGHKYGVGSANSYFSLANGATTYPTAIDLSDDKTTVTLTFAGGFKLSSYSEITVSSSLKSASGKAATAYKQAVLLDDTTAPTVSGVSYSGGAATVTFSEPLVDAGVVSINGAQKGTVSSTSAVYYTINRNSTAAGSNYGGDIKSITIYNLSADTNYTLNLVGGYDTAAVYSTTHAPNYFDYTATINVPSDNTAPTITSVTVEGDVITAKFSEAISVAGSVYQGSVDNVGVAGIVDPNDNTVATYTVGWRSGSFLNTTAIFKGYKDLVGNTGSNFSAAITLTLDTGNPTVASALYDGTYLAIKFNEALSTVDTTKTLTVKYTNSNNVVTYPNISLASATIGYDVNNDGDVTDSGENFYLRVAASLSNGTYSITVPSSSVYDKAASAHGNDSGTVSLTVSSSTTSGSVTVTVYTNGLSTDTAHYDGTLKNNQIKFDFKNKKLTTAALDKSKFLINGAPLPADANLYFLGDTNVVIAELPNGAIPVNGYRTIKVVNIVDENGNTLSSTLADVQQTVYMKENLKPVAQSVSVVSDTQIAVTFSETLGTLPSTLASGLTVKVNDVSVTITSWNVSDNVLYLNATSAPFSASKTTSVAVSGSSIVDTNGNTVADGTVTK